MREKVVLLVDADGDSEELVSKAAARSGWAMLAVKTSRAAFKIIRDKLRRLDLVIVDVDPGAHGLALLEAISGCADRPAILVITALEETYMKPIAQEHGAAACLGKPIALAKLKSTLDNVSASRSLTSDQWGNLVPPSVPTASQVKAGFRGIAGKLSPSPPRRRKES